MTVDRAALVEGVAQAISNAWDSEQRVFAAAEAAIDLIRAEVLEEAARVALEEYRRSSSGEEIAAAIRALKEKA
jgi:hypothetical protein